MLELTALRLNTRPYKQANKSRGHINPHPTHVFVWVWIILLILKIQNAYTTFQKFGGYK